MVKIEMIQCPACKKEISKKAMACPSCGHQIKKPGGINPKDPIHFLGIIIVILMIIGFILIALSNI
jgi:hypothetical protein